MSSTRSVSCSATSRTILTGVGGPDNVNIALVIHGPALRAFHSASANPDVSKRVWQFSKAGLEMAACGNTMKSQNVTVNELLPNFVLMVVVIRSLRK